MAGVAVHQQGVLRACEPRVADLRAGKALLSPGSAVRIPTHTRTAMWRCESWAPRVSRGCWGGRSRGGLLMLTQPLCRVSGGPERTRDCPRPHRTLQTRGSGLPAPLMGPSSCRVRAVGTTSSPCTRQGTHSLLRASASRGLSRLSPQTFCSNMSIFAPLSACVLHKAWNCLLATSVHLSRLIFLMAVQSIGPRAGDGWGSLGLVWVGHGCRGVPPTQASSGGAAGAARKP